MKKNRLSVLVVTLFSLFFSSCETIETLSPALTESEVAQGLREALRVGTDTSVTLLNVQDGYYKDAAVKILFPSEAQFVYDVVKTVPGGTLVLDEFEKKMNRAAEEAAIKAKPIFVNAITGITIQDAWGILRGEDTAATFYLKSKTEDSLTTAFLPDISAAMGSVGADIAWETVSSYYNTATILTGGQPITTDINAYVADKAIDGVFKKVADEEILIRKNPIKRVTDILKKVFAELDK